MNIRVMLAYVDGELDETQRSALVAETERNPDLLPVFAELYRQRFLLACALREQARLRIERPRQRQAAWWRPLAWAAAASLVAALGIRFMLHREGAPLMIGPAIATVTETVGQSQAFAPDGTRTVLAVGDVLLAEHRVETGPDARIRLAFPAESGEAFLSASSILSIASDSLLRLEQGALVASVPARSADRPFAVTTPNARAEIVGTHFAIQVARSPAPLSTRLDVEQGRVRLVRLADRATTDVTAGQFAVAGEDIVLKPYPRGTDRIEGAILLKDDFESGTLDNWHSLVGDWQVVPRPDGKGHCLKLAWKANDPITPRILARLDALPPDLEISYEFIALLTQYGFGPWFMHPDKDENVLARIRAAEPASAKKPVYSVANEWVRHVIAVRHGQLRLQAYQDGKLLYEKEGELAGPFTAVGLAGFNVRQDSDLYVDNVVIRQWRNAPAPDNRAERASAKADNDG